MPETRFTEFPELSVGLNVFNSSFTTCIYIHIYYNMQILGLERKHIAYLLLLLA